LFTTRHTGLENPAGNRVDHRAFILKKLYKRFLPGFVAMVILELVLTTLRQSQGLIS
jgi:hypothetical protein